MENRKFMEMEAKFVSVINDKDQLDAQWRSLDFNGNGIVSLAELDKWVVQSFPLLNNKAALRRAFIRTTTRDGDGDDWVQRREFKALLVNVIYFNRAFELFDSIDTGRDQRVDFEEFFAAVGRLGLGLDRKQALAEFQRIDRNGGGQLLFDEFCEWLVEINSFKFKERMRGTAYVESIVNGSSPATAVKQSPVASAGSLPLRANTVLNGSSPKLPSPAPMIRSRSLLSPSVGSSVSSASPSVGSSLSASAKAEAEAAALAEAAAKAFHRIEAQFVQFISSRDQLISQWSVLDSSSQGFVSFPAFELWLSRHFPDLHNPIALKRAFERLYDPKSGEPARLLFKDFGAILVNVLFFCRAVNAYKDCGLPVDTAVDLRDFQRLLVALNMGVIYAEALAQFRSVDTNDSGNVCFEEFSSWLVRQLGPKLMQNISESVQQTMRTQDKVSTTPESMKASRVSQTPQSASPSTPVGPAKFSFAEKSPSFVSTSPHLQDFASAHGKGFLPNASYFGLQIGINYTDSAAPLAGCVNDIRRWAELFRSFGCKFNVHIVCSDEDSRIAGTEKQRGAKKSDIMSALQDIRGAMLASEATNKFLFLNFSGHGGQEEDLDGDEDDGFDECLAPADYDVAGCIPDDMLSKWLRDLPQHTCFAVFDCCHR
jgi:Ca2+-binding EF-hand superfamily protein